MNGYPSHPIMQANSYQNLGVCLQMEVYFSSTLQAKYSKTFDLTQGNQARIIGSHGGSRRIRKKNIFKHFINSLLPKHPQNGPDVTVGDIFSIDFSALII